MPFGRRTYIDGDVSREVDFEISVEISGFRGISVTSRNCGRPIPQA
jgi:hypothetical protein